MNTIGVVSNPFVGIWESQHTIYKNLPESFELSGRFQTEIDAYGMTKNYFPYNFTRHSATNVPSKAADMMPPA